MPRLNGKWVEKYWLSTAIVVVVAAAFIIPEGGRFLLDIGLVDVGVVTVMLLSGMKIPFRRFWHLLRHPAAIIVALLSIFVVSPLVAVLIGEVYGFSGAPDRLAVLILAAEATTLASCIVLTEVAGGDVAFAVIVSLFANLLSAFLTPLIFEVFGNAVVEVDPLAMMGELALKIALPVVAGQLLRLPLETWVAKYAKRMSIFSQLVILTMLFTGISAGLERLSGGALLVAKIVVFAALLHGALLVINALLARLVSRSDKERCAFVLAASQKTLPAAILIWKHQFQALPMGVMIAVSYHLIQLVADSILAPGFRKLPLIRDKRGTTVRRDI